MYYIHFSFVDNVFILNKSFPEFIACNFTRKIDQTNSGASIQE